eukprot:CAMPEP_0196131972 /NCGR_PEP_ID=MMETSP0910-20130528/1759_1 /TAXON_ID=49265 /ORGANISM="Thalassiosira rotula, Strain GSO102" /LENGTH=564 /DNA_ID=CAMNT_0041391499 /DNA_START=258 /DNA_END=1952 /DNA_ORIENTATION=-
MNEVEGAGSSAPLPKNNNGSVNDGSKSPAPTTTTPAPDATAPLVVDTSLNQRLPPSVNVSPGQGTLSPASSGSVTTTATTVTTTNNKQPNTNQRHALIPFDANAPPAIPSIPSNPSPSPSSSTTTNTTNTNKSRKKPKVKESIIDHTYRDFSSVKVSLELDGENENQNRPNFTAKLHGIVSNPNYQHIICWLPHGRSWKIVDKYLLTSVVIPQHFSHAKFESFNRSVNGWGFKRLLHPGPDCKSYYHECFLRGRPELTRLMQRLINPGKRLPDKSGEPDFYEISKNFPLPPSLPPAPSSMPPSMPPSIPPRMPPSMSTPVSSSGKSQARTNVPPKSGLPSPNAGRPGQPPQPTAFASPPHHMNGYNMYGQYGYPQAALPHPPMPSQGQMPSPGGAPNQGPNRHPHHPHQPPPPHQMYWPGQVAGSPPYQPTPPYGYYPYPPQMAMAGPQGGQQQGYYMVQQPPYPPPGMHNPYFHPTHAAATPPQASGPPMDASEWMKQAERAARSDAGLDSATNPGEAGQDLNLGGQAVVAEVASVNGDNAGEPDEVKSGEQADSNAELTREV